MPARHIDVEDPDDPRLAPFTGLTDAELRRTVESADPSAPDDDGSFIVEGHLALAALLESGYPVRSILVSRSQVDRVGPQIDGLDRAVPVYVASQAVLDATVGFHLHRGVVAWAARTHPARAAVVAEGATRILVLEGVNDHENLGGLFRNAAAFGVGAVLLDPTCADPLYRRAVRVSMGHVLRVPFARVERWPEGLADVLDARGIETVALTPDPASPDIATVAGEVLGRARGIALLLGAEGPGLTGTARAAAHHQARIPMAPGVDSLNVATAAAVALYALREGRRL